MSDLIKEMRSFQLYPDHYLRLGADEIERLTAENKNLLTENMRIQARAGAAEAKVEALEGALALQCNFLRKIKSYANSNTTYDIEIAEMSDTALQRIEQALKADT